MPNVRIAPPPKFSSELVTGAPLVGGKLYTYTAGTSTPYDTYTDYTGGTANSNPVILDSRGECDLWLVEGVAYKLVLHDASDVPIWSVDGVNYSGAGGVTYLAANGTVAAPSFAFSNSTGMGFYRIANNILGVATAGAEAMRVDDSQNVGIGVAPTVKFDVNGATKIRGALTVTTGGIAITAGGITVTAGGAVITAGGLTIAAGGATIAGTVGITGATTVTGAMTVASGVFSSRGFVDNATAAAWNIDASGRLLNNGVAQPMFRAYLSGNQTSGTTIIFNSEQTDQGANYNNATGVFTAPVAGVYLLTAGIVCSNSTGAEQGMGFTIAASSAGTLCGDSMVVLNSTSFSGSCSSIARLAQGETVSVGVSNSLSASLYIAASGATFFSAALLG